MANMNKFSGGSAELTGNARPEDVAQGKTFYSNDENTKLVGTLPVRDGGYGENIIIWDKRLYIRKIEEGIYKRFPNNAQGPKVSVPADLLGNADAGCVLNGVTFSSSNGIKLPGRMANNGSWSKTINPNETITIPQGYHSGYGTLKAVGGGVAWNGNAHATSPTLDSHNAPISYILFSCYDGQTYECYLDWSDDGNNWYEWTHSGGGTGQYVGSIKQGTASGHRYWRLRAGSAPNWSLGGAIFIS